MKLRAEVKSLNDVHLAFVETKEKLSSATEIKEIGNLKNLEKLEVRQTIEKLENLTAELKSINVGHDASLNKLEDKLKDSLRKLKTVMRGYH